MFNYHCSFEFTPGRRKKKQLSVEKENFHPLSPFYPSAGWESLENF